MGGLCLPTQFIAIPIQMGGFIMAAHDIVANRSSESFWPKHRSVQPFNEKMRWITRLELRRSLQISIATLHNLGNSSNSKRSWRNSKKHVPIKYEHSTNGSVCSVWDHWEEGTFQWRAILLGISGKSWLKTALAEGVAVAGTVDAARDVDYPPKMGKVSDIVPLNVCVVYMTKGLSLRQRRRRILMVGSVRCFGPTILPFF